MAAGIPDPEQLSEEQLRAAYEQEIKRLRVEEILLDNVVTMLNLGMRRTGRMPGTEDERDLAQVQLAIDSVRALLPQIEQIAPSQLAPIRDALAQMQLAFVQAQGAGGGHPSAPGPAGPGGPGPGGSSASQSMQPGSGEPGASPSEPPAADGPGPAQRSGRLWVPGQ